MEMQIHNHLHFSLFLHRLKTSCDALNCGLRTQILLLTSRFGEANDTITTEFVLLIFPLTFGNIPFLFPALGCLSVMINLDLRLPQYQSDLMINQKYVKDWGSRLNVS